MEQYRTWINSNADQQPGKNLNFEYFTLVYGTLGFLSIGNDDTIVSISDENQIFSLINSNNKRLLNVTTLHIGMGDNEEVKNYVKTSLDKSIY